MQNFLSEKDGLFTVKKDSSITETIREAIDLSAKKNNRPIKFEFNYVLITVRGDSDPNLIYRDYWRAFNGYIDKNIGPYPNPELTDEEKANDARIEAEKKHKCAA